LRQICPPQSKIRNPQLSDYPINQEFSYFSLLFRNKKMLSFLTYIIVGLLGLMMGTVYKRSFSNVEMLRISPHKIARIYGIIVFLSALICAYLSYKAISSFTAQDADAEGKAQFFQDYQSMLVYFLNLGFILMIIFSNLHSFAAKKISWLLYLLTFGIYASFAVIDNFFLQDTFFHFKKMNQLWAGEFSFANFLGYFNLIASAGLTVFNAYMTYWGLKK
jgi:uncharacterized membrane protein YbjE (DUF340 family)